MKPVPLSWKRSGLTTSEDQQITSDGFVVALNFILGTALGTWSIPTIIFKLNRRAARELILVVPFISVGRKIYTYIVKYLRVFQTILVTERPMTIIVYPWFSVVKNSDSVPISLITCLNHS